MSTEFYFKKWKQTLAELETILRVDIEYQETKAHDHKLCEASHRISSVLCGYIYVYNLIWEDLDMNIQVQKTDYIYDVMTAVLARILELKHELRKLEVSQYHFLNNGIIENKKSPDNVELAEIPHKVGRQKHIQNILDEAFEKCEEKRRLMMEEEVNGKPEKQPSKNWWEIDGELEEEEIEEEQEVLTVEQAANKKYVEIIQAQERSRQVIQSITQSMNKRQRWEKELAGTAVPPAPIQIRENSAKLIQKVCRTYFALKRQRQEQIKRDQLTGLLPVRLWEQHDYKERLEQIDAHRTNLKNKYDEDLQTDIENQKQNFLKRKSDDIKEDYRDAVRDWFKEWYETINMFHEIPDLKRGGVEFILKGDLPSPLEWLEEYNDYLIQKKSNKNKSAMALKYEKLEAKRELMMQKKEQQIKKKLEEQLRQKMMKNPSLHPGYNYPESKKTQNLLQVIEKYHKHWDDLDETKALDNKEGFDEDINRDHAYTLARLELVPAVEEDMRKELGLLKAALKRDYENSGKKPPQPMIRVARRRKGKKKKLKKCPSENLTDKLESLVFQGFIREYPKTKLDEFIGDPNFIGGDIRSNCGLPLPDNGETRNVWWESCRELSHGFHRILLIGPRGGGKTKLLHILASLNDAVLFELDPSKIRPELRAAVYLEPLVTALLLCARAAQPSVLHLRHAHNLYHRKVPSEDADIDWELFRTYFVTKLFKKIQKTDRITVVATCVDPWITKSKRILKKFPSVILLPNTSYSTVYLILTKWVNSHTVIPVDLDVSSLSHMLKGYSFGFIQDTLEKFMSADRIAKIAARGLSPKEIFDFFLEAGVEKPNYDKYVTWYQDKTTWGRKEKKHLEEQLAFRKAVEEFELKKKKKGRVNHA